VKPQFVKLNARPLLGEGMDRRVLLSISINLNEIYFDKINKNKKCV
jgi:hypothetical protein